MTNCLVLIRFCFVFEDTDFFGFSLFFHFGSNRSTIDIWSTNFNSFVNITKLEHIVNGGENGQGSIRNGVYELEKYFDKDDIVLIHDAIRPMVSAEI